jgi:gamma-glutamyltranspeptidase/glutathione hydrolase
VSTLATVAAGHPDTVAAAVAVLEQGGNAFDATVAAGFAAAACEPGLTSLGGGGFLLARTRAGAEVLFDFFVDTPGRGRASLEPHFTPVTIAFRGATQVFNVGYGSVAVPGCLPGYVHVHDRLGRLDLAAVVEPARRLAVEGVVCTEPQAQVLALLAEVFALADEGRAIVAGGGRPVGAGDRIEQPAYADLLTEIGAGRVRSFAHPELASALEQAMDAGSGLLTAADLEAYRVIERAPLCLELDRGRVLTNPPPSFGGSLIADALADPALTGETGGPSARPGDPRWLVAVARALARVDSLHRRGPSAMRGTTHISVCDAEGNVASMTTSNGSCSGVFVPGTGVHLNNILGEADLHPDGFHSQPPGVRVGSMMAPSVLAVAGGPAIAVGSGGSERIRSALVQVLARLLHAPHDLAGAVEAPRMHWDGERLHVEPGLGARAEAALSAQMPVQVWPARDLYFGGAHAASTDGRAAGDPRRGGSVAVVGP